MSEDFQKIKDKCIKYNFFNKEEVSAEKYKSLSHEEKENYFFEKEGELKKYYKRIPIELNNEELALSIQIHQLKIAKGMNQKVETIKFILVLWLIISIFSAFIMFGVIHINL